MNKSLATGMGIVFLLSICVKGGEVENAISNVIAICEASRYSTVPAVEDMGFRVEVYTQDVFFAAAAFLSNNWATGAVSIRGWTFLGTGIPPEPGWIVGHPSPSGMGHCGIVDYDGFGIAAGFSEVNRRFERFLDGTCGYNRKDDD